jgi:argininosuccinate lyase
MSQVMITLSRLATDLMLYSMPEFGYFTLPAEHCTGSSIMPQKRNPDVLELVRARAARVTGHVTAVSGILSGLPGGYNRDLQETKEPFMDGMATASACVRIMRLLVAGLGVDKAALSAGFTPEIFATDEVSRLVAGGMSFRDAYNRVKAGLAGLSAGDSAEAIRRKTHVGGTAGLDFAGYSGRVSALKKFAGSQRRKYHGAVSGLLGVKYPELKK